jgi:hypothetical protein
MVLSPKLTGFLDVEPALPIPGFGVRGGVSLVPPFFLSVSPCAHLTPVSQTGKVAHGSRSPPGTG